ncbi:MAG: copper amine oxidase N-terminal domain-containing protein [Clostridia bacterium]|nr:copper amine oxidase N-terminal domain-containing protein [Clostridia bacterium]
MKKIIISVFLVISMLFASICGVYAAPAASTQITTVLVDGNVTIMNPMPQIISNEVYFPVGSALTVMGVKAGSKSVKIGKANADITVTKADKKLYAKLNSKSATVNGKTVKLKAPMIVQKNVLYIPGELIGKFIGKKVIFSNKLKTVSVAGENELKKVKALLDEVEATMNKVNDYKFKLTMTMDMFMDMGTAKTSMSADGKVDVANKNSYTSTKITTEAMGQSMDMDTEAYTINGVTYAKNPLTEEWESSTQEDMGLSFMSGLFGESSEAATDAAYVDVINSSCKITTDKSGKITKISSSFLGKIISEGSLKDVFDGGKPSSIDATFEIDNATKTITGMTMNFSGSINTQGVKMKFNAKFTMSIFDYNKGVTIEIPDELKD